MLPFLWLPIGREKFRCSVSLISVPLFLFTAPPTSNSFLASITDLLYEIVRFPPKMVAWICSSFFDTHTHIYTGWSIVLNVFMNVLLNLLPLLTAKKIYFVVIVLGIVAQIVSLFFPPPMIDLVLTISLLWYRPSFSNYWQFKFSDVVFRVFIVCMESWRIGMWISLLIGCYIVWCVAWENMYVNA